MAVVGQMQPLSASDAASIIVCPHTKTWTRTDAATEPPHQTLYCESQAAIRDPCHHSSCSKLSLGDRVGLIFGRLSQ